jgi:hypothetical protein
MAFEVRKYSCLWLLLEVEIKQSLRSRVPSTQIRNGCSPSVVFLNLSSAGRFCAVANSQLSFDGPHICDTATYATTSRELPTLSSVSNFLFCIM